MGLLGPGSKSQIQLVADGIVLQEGRAHGTVHFASIEHLRLQTELGQSGEQGLQIAAPVEFRIGCLQDEAQIFREARQLMEDPQARAALKGGHLEKGTAPQ